MTMIDDTKAEQCVMTATTAVLEKSNFTGTQALIFLPATTSDRQKGFDEMSGEAFAGGPAFAALTADQALADTVAASATICRRSSNPEESVYIKHAPDCWGGSLEPETIISSRLVLNQHECWYVAHTEDYVEVRTLSFPVDMFIEALRGNQAINFFPA